MRTLEDRTLLLLIIAVSLAFAWILWPVFSAVLWATVSLPKTRSDSIDGEVRPECRG